MRLKRSVDDDNIISAVVFFLFCMTRVVVDAFVEPGATAALSSSRLTNNHALVRLPGRSVGGRKIHWSLMNADDDSGDVVAVAASSRRRSFVEREQ